MSVASSETVAGRQPVQTRKTADSALKKADDEALLVIISNVTAFRRSRSMSKTKVAAKPDASNQVTLLKQEMDMSWTMMHAISHCQGHDSC